MENQRFFLYLALAFLLYIIWLTWQQEHAPKPVTQQDNGQQISELNGVDGENNYEDSADLPEKKYTFVLMF